MKMTSEALGLPMSAMLKALLNPPWFSSSRPQAKPLNQHLTHYPGPSPLSSSTFPAKGHSGLWQQNNLQVDRQKVSNSSLKLPSTPRRSICKVLVGKNLL